MRLSLKPSCRFPIKQQQKNKTAPICETVLWSWKTLLLKKLTGNNFTWNKIKNWSKPHQTKGQLNTLKKKSLLILWNNRFPQQLSESLLKEPNNLVLTTYISHATGRRNQNKDFINYSKDFILNQNAPLILYQILKTICRWSQCTEWPNMCGIFMHRYCPRFNKQQRCHWPAVTTDLHVSELWWIVPNHRSQIQLVISLI